MTAGTRRAAAQWWILAVIAAVVIIVGWLTFRSPPEAAVSTWEIPNPTTPDMSAPLAEAISAARQRISREPSSAATWGELGAVLDAHHLYEPALLCYERAHALDGDDFRWSYLAATVQDFLGTDPEKMLALFDAAMRRQPAYPPLHFRRGEALMRTGRIEAARDAYAEAVAHDDDFAMAQRGLGQALLALDDTAAAIAHLERAETLDPRDSIAPSTLARAFRLHGDEAAAIRAAERARSRQPALSVPDPIRYDVEQRALTVDAGRSRAAAHMTAGRFADAREELHRVVQMLPDDARDQLRLGICAMELNEPNVARGHLRTAVSIEPDLVEAHRRLALLYEDDGAFDAAIAAYRIMLEHEPANVAVQGRVALLLAMRGDLAGSIAAFRAAEAMGPLNAEIRTNWGTALLRANDPLGAAAQFRGALQLEPRNANIIYNLGQALEHAGRPGDAIEQYRRAAQINPTHEAARRLQSLQRGRP